MVATDGGLFHLLSYLIRNFPVRLKPEPALYFLNKLLQLHRLHPHIHTPVFLRKQASSENLHHTKNHEEILRFAQNDEVGKSYFLTPPVILRQNQRIAQCSIRNQLLSTKSGDYPEAILFPTPSFAKGGVTFAQDDK